MGSRGRRDRPKSTEAFGAVRLSKARVSSGSGHCNLRLIDLKTPLFPLPSAGFGIGDDGFLQNLEHRRDFLDAKPHRFRVGGLRQRKQRGRAARSTGTTRKWHA